MAGFKALAVYICEYLILLSLIENVALIMSIRIVELLINRIQLIFAGHISYNAQEWMFENRVQFFRKDDDHKECLYYLQMLSNLIQYSPSNIWSALASPTATISNNADEPTNRM